MGGMVNRPGGFQGMLENPMFMAGLGMLSGNQQNRPFAGMLAGVNAAQNQKEYQRQKKREEQLRQLITKAQPGSPLTTPAPVGSNNWMVPPQFAGTTSAGASQGVSAYVPRETPPQPNIDELAMAFMQFGTPEQQAAGLRHLSSKDQYSMQLDAELARDVRDRRAELDMISRKAELQADLREKYPWLAQQDMPADVLTYQFWRDLPTDEARQEMLLTMRQPRQMPSQILKEVITSTNKMPEVGGEIARLEDVAARMLAEDPASGVFGRGVERMKELLGSQDEATLVRKNFIEIKNQDFVQKLPPGIASDKDVSIIFRGALDDFANAHVIGDNLRAAANFKRIEYEYNKFKANYIAAEKTVVGLADAWEQHLIKLRDEKRERTGNPEAILFDDPVNLYQRYMPGGRAGQGNLSPELMGDIELYGESDAGGW